MGMRPGIIFCLLAGGWAAVPPAWGGIDELARTGQWQRLLEVANRRADQLPLQPEEAFLAAHAARMVGDGAAERRYLERAVEGGPLRELAGVELAPLLLPDEPDRSVDLVAPLLRTAPSRQIRAAAVEVVAAAVTSGVDGRRLSEIAGATRSLPGSLRRELELALARRDASGRRDRLDRLLTASTSDLTALQSARLLQTEPELSATERWLVAKTLYRHALYDEAESALAGLAGVRSPQVPAWEVAFLSGRCAFRRGRWAEAAALYRTALAGRQGAEGRAEIQVHLARVYELAGDLTAAVEAARQAVVSRTDDDRRLFLARLRLRLDQPDMARAGIAKIRGRTARERGKLMMGLYEFRRKNPEAARALMEGVGRRPWRAPASVLAAGLAVSAGDHDGAVTLLERHATELGSFWADRARMVMARLPEVKRKAWRVRCAASLAGSDGRPRRTALVRWIALEVDPEVLEGLRREVADEVDLEVLDDPPAFPSGLADLLWKAGLPGEAVRWDPGGMPLRNAEEALWSARQFDRLNAPWLAIRTADAAWRLAGSDIPTRGYPEPLQRALHPLPYPELVWKRAVEGAVPWTLLAGVAREESRWDPTVLSQVGARGLMQLMPATASVTAHRLGRPLATLDDLFDPDVSLELGAAEISRLYTLFEGQPAPVVAAYNAGEVQARLWLDQCGSPCPPDWYVANVTFTATSGYSRDVLAAAGVYVELYGAAMKDRAADSEE